MKKVLVCIIAFTLFLYAEDSTTVDTSLLDTVSEKRSSEEVTLEETIPANGKQFLIAGYSCIAAGILSLGCAASFNAGADNRPSVGDPIQNPDSVENEDPELKRYARICAWTGLVLELSSIPFLVVGYRKKKRHKAFIDRKLYGFVHSDGTVEVRLSCQF